MDGLRDFVSVESKNGMSEEQKAIAKICLNIVRMTCLLEWYETPEERSCMKLRKRHSLHNGKANKKPIFGSHLQIGYF